MIKYMREVDMKILIFYGSFGGGHLSAAKSIKEYIEQNYSGHETLVVDCVEYVNKAVNKISTKAYEEMAKTAPKLWGKVYEKAQSGYLAKATNISNYIMAQKLNSLFSTYSPDLVISTHPFATQMSAVIRRHKKRIFKIATVLTDYAPHEQWLVDSAYSSYFFVAHEKMKQDLIATGIDEYKVHATGIPLSNKFLQNYNKQEILNTFNLEEGKFTVLFFAGGELGLRKKQYI